MRVLITTLFILNTCFTVLAQPLNRTIERYNGDIHLVGRVTLDRLQSEPYKEWFFESFDAYEVDNVALEEVNTPDSVTIFLGTWCGDSKREVPRFIKMLQEMDFDSSKIGIISLNTGFQNYKQAPEREEAGMDIHRVPTFIFHDVDKEEIGRIVEEPVVSLEQDFAGITNGKPYETFYAVANDLIKKFNTLSIKEIQKIKSDMVKEYTDKTVSESELNTYGYVLWTSFNLVKAELVFELNYQLYPSSVRTTNALARFKANIGKQKEAWKYLNAGIKANPEDEVLLELARIWKAEGL